MKRGLIIIIIAVVVIGVVIAGILVWQTSCSDSHRWSITKGCYSDPAGLVPAIQPEAPTSATNSTTTTTNTSVEEVAAIPSNSPAIYYRESLGTIQNRLRTYDVNWESSSSVLVRDLPTVPQLDAFHSYTSSSYSKQSKYPITNNGRLFLLTDWGSEWTSDNNRWNLVEYDPLTNERSGADISFRSDNFAVVGNNLYLTTPVTKDRVGGWVTSYGSLEAVSLDESSDLNATTVFDFTGYEDRGGLYGAGDTLFVVRVADQLLSVKRFNHERGTMDPLYHDLLVDDFSSQNIFPGDDALYILTKEGSDVYINRYPVVGEPESILVVELGVADEDTFVGEDDGTVVVMFSSTGEGGTKIREAFTYNLTTEEIVELEVSSFSVPLSYSRIGVPFLVLNK